MPSKNPLEDIPQFLKAWPYWAAWATPHADSKRRPLDLRRALAPCATSAKTDIHYLDHWASYDFARIHLEKVAPAIPYSPPVPVGVGILVNQPKLVKDDGIAFIDFDDLIDEQGNVPVWASNFIKKARGIGGYIEKSAGGAGVHVFLRVPHQISIKRNRFTKHHPTAQPVGIEVYCHQRFAALTGIPVNRHEHPDEMNSAYQGTLLIREFLEELEATAAPICTVDLKPLPKVMPRLAPANRLRVKDMITPNVRAAFDNPAQAFEAWAERRKLTSQDNSLSAWRFSTFLEASRQAGDDPAPLYELFNPTDDPAHPGVEEWQEFSGHNKKTHRRYVDIQRAHALVQQEMKLLFEEERDDGLGELLTEAEEREALTPEVVRIDHQGKAYKETRVPKSIEIRETGIEGLELLDENPSWTELGLVMKMGAKGAYPLPTSVNIIRLVQRHPYFRNDRIERNLLTGVTMHNRVPLADTQITRWQEPLRAGLGSDRDPSPESVRGAVEVIADDNSYDPLIEHLEALPKWQPDSSYTPDKSLLSNWLERIGAKPSSDIKRFSRRIILGLIARALDPGCKFDYVPVFEGEQGLGKSTLVKLLVTPEFYCTIIGGLQNKDARITLRGHWGVEISELASFKKTDNESLKEFFSTDTDSFRSPYERANRDIKRRTVLFGTTNERQYLNDPTGARRYWAILFDSLIDLEWFKAHREQIFAEGLYWYRKGETFHDTFAELKSPERQKMLNARMSTPAWQMRILQHLQSLPKPHIPVGAEELGFSGIVTPSYVVGLQKTLDLPQSVMHLSPSVLASFIKRAGYVSIRLAYRHPDKPIPSKLSVWVHPALTFLSSDQLHCFLAHFPSIFPADAMPASWHLLQEEHLQATMDVLKDAPGFEMIDFSGEDTDA